MLNEGINEKCTLTENWDLQFLISEFYFLAKKSQTEIFELLFFRLNFFWLCTLYLSVSAEFRPVLNFVWTFERIVGWWLAFSSQLSPKITTKNCINLNPAWLFSSNILLTNTHVLIYPISINLCINTRSWPARKFSTHLPPDLDPWTISSMVPLFLKEFSSVFPSYLCFAPSTRPMHFLYSLTKESYTQTEGLPTQENHLPLLKLKIIKVTFLEQYNTQWFYFNSAMSFLWTHNMGIFVSNWVFLTKVMNS